MAKYSVNLQKSNRGEAFLMFLLSKRVLANKISGANDIGLDFLCEWVYNEDPSGLLFAIQVKTVDSEIVDIEAAGTDTRLSNLEKFTIKNKKTKSSYPRIKNSTLEYWKNFEIPIYLFVVIERGIDEYDCYYKRYTPILHQADMREAEKDELFRKVYNSGNTFLAYSNLEEQIGGFLRDLFIDYIRCKYYKGHLAYINPRKIGLNQFLEDGTFNDLYEEYKAKIDMTYKKYQEFYKNLPNKNNA